MRSIITKPSLLLTAFFSICASVYGQNIDNSSTNRDEYKDEVGYYQKAYRDVNDPQFMFTDGSGKLAIGIGGTVHVTGYYDFAGSVDGFAFKTSSITVPYDKSRQFGYSASSSNVYLKARSDKGPIKVTAYLEISDDQLPDGDYIRLFQSYISLGSFTFGRTYSFFMDLESGARTVDLCGPNTQVDNTHSLVGYTQRFSDKFSVAMALEQPYEITSNFEDEELVSGEHTKYPDVTAHVKYHGNRGHIQVGTVWRQLSYWASLDGFDSRDKGKSVYRNGFGVAISGNLRASAKLTLSGQVVSGKGISNYIRDLGGLNVNLVEEPFLDNDGYTNLSPVKAYGGFLAANYKWTDKFESSLVYGVCHLHKEDNQFAADNFKQSNYCAANLFYFLTQNCFAGIEYNFGHKTTYSSIKGIAGSGHANRINACLVYRF